MDHRLRWALSHRRYSCMQLADQSAQRSHYGGAVFAVAVDCFSDCGARKFSCLQDLEERLMMQSKIAIGLLSLVFCPLPLEASTLLRVIDGDRVIASFQGKPTKIRLACIDAPEIGQAPHGRIARNTLIGLLPRHSRIKVQPLNFDHNGWLVANIFSLGGVDIGEELIRLGLVYVYKTSLSDCDGPKLLLIEDQARQSRIGIWKDTQRGLSRPWLD